MPRVHEAPDLWSTETVKETHFSPIVNDFMDTEKYEAENKKELVAPIAQQIYIVSMLPKKYFKRCTGWKNSHKRGLETKLKYSSCKTFLTKIADFWDNAPPPRPLRSERFSCQHARASSRKTGVMGKAAVINSREGNEVTVDSQFSQRKLAFITHLILRSKQVSCARLSRGIWQLLLQKPSSRYDEEKGEVKINGIGGEEENTSVSEADETLLCYVMKQQRKC